MSYGILKGDVVIAAFTSPMKVYSNEPVFVNDSLSLKRRSFRRSSQRWEIETMLEPLRDNAEALMTHRILKGVHTTFQILFPQNFGIILKGFAPAGATCTGTAFSSFAVISGLLDTIYEGTFIQFANHSKIYLVTEDRVGNGNLKVFPPLLNAVPPGTAVKYGNDIKASFKYDIDALKGMQYTDGVLMDIGSVKLVEVL